MGSPFRSELDSLRAENERLRVALKKEKRPARAFLAVTLALLDVAAIVLLKPWLNGSSDARFWSALVFLFVLAFAAAHAALGPPSRHV